MNADCVIAIGADMVDDHQVAGFIVKRALPIGVHLICVDDKAINWQNMLMKTIDPAGKLAEAMAKVKASDCRSKAGKISIVLGSGSFLTAEISQIGS